MITSISPYVINGNDNKDKKRTRFIRYFWEKFEYLLSKEDEIRKIRELSDRHNTKTYKFLIDALRNSFVFQFSTGKDKNHNHVIVKINIGKVSDKLVNGIDNNVVALSRQRADKATAFKLIQDIRNNRGTIQYSFNLDRESMAISYIKPLGDDSRALKSKLGSLVKETLNALDGVTELDRYCPAIESWEVAK